MVRVDKERPVIRSTPACDKDSLDMSYLAPRH